MKDSLAKALRHSREMAHNTYDGHTAVKKNTMAVSLGGRQQRKENNRQPQVDA